MKIALRLIVVLIAGSTFAAPAVKPAEPMPREIEQLFDYFKHETALLASNCLAHVASLEEWAQGREERRHQLQEMLGLWPMPERTELKPVITGTVEREGFRVEKLHFQASPGLFVTANLYLPKSVEMPVPGVLYLCGHSRVITNGVSYGNKVGYQHYGAWFAQNGYVCLTVDTLQMGEIQGAHRGTYSENQWWWNSRGYTPAGVEAWFGIRGLDYLSSRPEVDAQRLGVTGRSGGGAYSWTVAALDERVKVAAPAAGITDLENHVVDGTVEGHCDCMFHVNTYRWDFPQLAAMIAPRPLLILNSDKDRIFPLEGVVRLHEKVRRIYRLHDRTNHLGLLINDGPHADTQDQQVPIFRWFNRFLKNEDPIVEMAARPFFTPPELKVFDQVPAGQINTRIQETFVPRRSSGGSLGTREIELLRQKAFAGWPGEETVTPPARLVAQTKKGGLHFQCYEFESQPWVPLSLVTYKSAKLRKPSRLVLEILDSADLETSIGGSFWTEKSAAKNEAALRQESETQKAVLAFFTPRGVERTDWLHKAKRAPQVRRRFMLLGQTLDSMRVWDIRQASQILPQMPGCKDLPVEARARGTMGVNAAYAALFEPSISKLRLSELPNSHDKGPDYLNVLRITDIAEVLQALGSRAQ